MSDPREELAALRRLAELEDKAAGKAVPSQDFMRGSVMENVGQYKIGREGFTDALKEVMKFNRPEENLAVGVSTAFDDAGMRAKQLFGGQLTPDQQLAVQANRTFRQESPMGTAGNIVGNMAMTMAPTNAAFGAMGAGLQALPSTGMAANLTRLAAPTAVAAATGAANSFLTNPTLPGESAASQAGNAAMGSAVADVATRSAARIIQPMTQNANVQALTAQGIKPTPGQAAGPNSIVGRVEQALTSIPVVGSIIQNARNRAGQIELDLAALRDSVPPSQRDRIREVGRAGLRRAEEIIDDGYRSVLGTFQGIRPDNRFSTDVGNIVQNATQSLSRENEHLLHRLIDSRVDQVISRVPSLDGEAAKRIDASLGALAREYRGANGPQEREIGRAIDGVQTAWRDLINRNAPNAQASRDLQELNTAYRNYLRVERASGYTGSDNGIFSPNSLNRAVHAMDRSMNHRAYALGRAPMQSDLVDPAMAVMRDTVRDSGTANRLMTAEVIRDLWNTALGNSVNPRFYLGLGAAPLAAAAYSRPGVRYLTGDYALQGLLGQGMRNLEPYAANVGSNMTRP